MKLENDMIVLTKIDFWHLNYAIDTLKQDVEMVTEMRATCGMNEKEQNEWLEDSKGAHQIVKDICDILKKENQNE